MIVRARGNLASSASSSGRTCRQLIQQYVQKWSRITRPRRSARRTGCGVLNHSIPSGNSGAWIVLRERGVMANLPIGTGHMKTCEWGKGNPPLDPLSSAEYWHHLRPRCFVRGEGPRPCTQQTASPRPSPRTRACVAGTRPGAAGRRPSSDSPPDCAVSGGLSHISCTVQ